MTVTGENGENGVVEAATKLAGEVGSLATKANAMHKTLQESVDTNKALVRLGKQQFWSFVVGTIALVLVVGFLLVMAIGNRQILDYMRSAVEPDGKARVRIQQAERQRDANLLVEFDCRVRRAMAGEPMLEPGRPCIQP